MNKLHYFAAVAAGVMTLAGCSSDEVVSMPEKTQAIGFSAMADKSSRTEVTTSNFERFRVFGCVMDNGTTANHATIFDNVTVSRTLSPLTDWAYDNLQYWAPNKDYYFVALSTNVANPVWGFTAPADHPADIDVDNFLGYGTVTMDISRDHAQNDLVYSYDSRATDAEVTNSTKVAFTFHHMLSRIGLKFTNAIVSTGYTVSISDVTVGGLTQSGSVELGVDPANLAWTATSENPLQIAPIVPDNNLLAKDQSTQSDYRFIIPGEQTLAIQFTVTVKLNGAVYSTRTMSGTIAATTYKPGHSYMFNAEITVENIVPGGAKPIEFTVTDVDGWTSEDEGAIEIPTE